ncbi:MAG TPA: hypothetical protein VFS18_03490 [Actinomycetota bacterium]|nr:hypothetical protein [Actinomycetota bacterium]
MEELVVAIFLIAHGAIHPAIYVTPPDPVKPPPFDASHSWALSATDVEEQTAHTLSVGAAWLTAASLSASGIALLLGVSGWSALAISGAITGIILKGLFFHPWLSLGIMIDVAILVAVASEWPASLF